MGCLDKYRNGFETGSIKINVWLDDRQGLDVLFANNWNQGFLAFSRGEKWLKAPTGEDLKSMVETTEPEKLGHGLGGICMEINMWRSTEQGYEELCMEREGTNWYAQYWQLSEDPVGHGATCYYKDCKLKDARTEEPYQTKEIIVPDQRIHFFMTIKRGA